MVSREALYEDESFPERELAALVAAKVYYHLQEYNESMVFALGAGKLFKIDQSGEFEETIIGKFLSPWSYPILGISDSLGIAFQQNVSIPSSPFLLPNDRQRVTSRPT